MGESGIPEGPPTQGNAGPGEVGEPRTDNILGESLVREPVEEDFQLAVTPEPAKPDTTAVAEVPVAPEQKQKYETPRQMAEALINASKKGNLESLGDYKSRQGGTEHYQEVAKKIEKETENALKTLQNLPDSVVAIVLPSETMKAGQQNEAYRLIGSLENFREGFWGYNEGSKATVIMSTINKGVPTDRQDSKGERIYNYWPEPATADMRGNALANGHEYREMSGGHWAIIIDKTS